MLSPGGAQGFVFKFGDFTWDIPRHVSLIRSNRCQKKKPAGSTMS